MKKINKFQPKIMVGMEFNIPLFAAKNQMYKCVEVEEHNQNQWKEYTLIFRYVPIGYSVPDDIKVILRFQQPTQVSVDLYEIREMKDIFLNQSIVNINKLRTLASFKETLNKLAI